MIRLYLLTLLCAFSISTQVQANALSSFSALKNAGLLVVDTQGQQLLADNNQRAFIPASTTKIVTAWLALYRWGENHRFSTDFHFDHQSNTLTIKGSGDPFLVSEELLIIANNLSQRGINRVDRIILDGSAFSSGLILPGTGRTNNPYDAVPSALAANFNTVNLKRVKRRIRSAESQTPLTPIAKRMYRGIKKKKLRVNLGRDPRKAERYFGELLFAMLKKQGVSVGGQIQQGIAPQQAPFYKHLNTRTLGDMIRPMMKYSTNFIANQLVLMMAQEQFQRPANARDVQSYMEDNLRAHFKWTGITFQEGAGLSRKNRISPKQLVELLQNFTQYRHLLPEVETGVFAKSGTLNKVSTLAGYIVDGDQWKPFALMMNQAVPHKLRNRIAKELRRTL